MHPRLAQLALTAALAGAITLSAWAEGPARLLGAFALDGPDPMLGGLSAIEVTDGGRGIVLLSDRGALFRGTVARGGSGEVTGVALAPAALLMARSGERGQRGQRDSEGLAMDGRGRLFLSFEGDHRVVMLTEDGAVILPAAPGFAAMEANGSLEALAVDAEGRLYTLPEVSEGPEIPVFRHANGQWQQALSIPRLGSFRPVGADFDDRGRFYLLERDFSLLFGFAARIRVFDLDPEGFSGGRIAWQSGHGAFSNLEGLSIWRDGQGRLVASMVSDDNFSPILPTELVEVILE